MPDPEGMTERSVPLLLVQEWVIHSLSSVTVHRRINQFSGKPEAAFDGFTFGRRHPEGTILSKFRLRKKAANCKIIKKTIMRRRNYHVIDP